MIPVFQKELKGQKIRGASRKKGHIFVNALVGVFQG
jgi:hypothetical protein